MFPMKPVVPYLLLMSLLTVGSCKPKSGPQPAIADTDVLMQASGYWEWEGSTTRGGQITPASVGFRRELIFKNDSLVHIFHNRRPAIQPAYQLSSGILSQCGRHSTVPLVRYAAEPQIPNNELRTYFIRISPTDTTLVISGAAVCMDAGYYETYRWHRH